MYQFVVYTSCVLPLQVVMIVHLCFLVFVFEIKLCASAGSQSTSNCFSCEKIVGDRECVSAGGFEGGVRFRSAACDEV